MNLRIVGIVGLVCLGLVSAGCGSRGRGGSGGGRGGAFTPPRDAGPGADGDDERGSPDPGGESGGSTMPPARCAPVIGHYDVYSTVIDGECPATSESIDFPDDACSTAT